MSRPTAHPGSIWLVASVLMLVLSPAGPMAAQETYELSDEGFEKVAEPDPATPEGRLQAIRRALAEDRFKDAEKQAGRWIDDYPNHSSLPQAHLLRGDARAGRAYYFKALFDYEYIARVYPGSPEFAAALERELKIAQMFGRGLHRRLWGIRMIPAGDEAEELLIRIQERAPGSKLAERAGIELGDYYYRQSHMRLAADAYDLFQDNYPNSNWKQHAIEQQIKANLATFKGPRFDATGLLEAQRRLAEYKQRFPAGADQLGAEPLLGRIDESLAEKDFLVARWYERQGKLVSARYGYRRVIKDFAGSAAALKAMERLKELDPEWMGVDAVPGLAPAETSGISPLPEPAEASDESVEGRPEIEASQGDEVNP